MNWTIVDNVAIGKKGYKVSMVAMFIDMRNSSNMMIQGWKETSAKVHKAFATTVAETVIKYGGKLRDFQGDGILAFWPAKITQIRKAVECALVIKWLLRNEFDSYFKRYLTEGVDFGIGIHWADGLVVRAGTTSKTQNNDLIYISPSVNIASILADKGSSSYNIRITADVLTNLDEPLTYNENNHEDIWETDYNTNIQWGSKNLTIYKTHYWWTL